MKERTVLIQLGETELEVYAGNMAVMRYHRAGGLMDKLELLDRCFSGPPASEDEAAAGDVAASDEGKASRLSHDEILEATLVAAQYLAANLVRDEYSADDLVNLAGNLSEPVLAYVIAARSMPALEGEDSEEATTDSSTSGLSPSSSLDGPRIDSGASAERSGG